MGDPAPGAHAGPVLRRDRQLAAAQQVETDLDLGRRHLCRVLPGIPGDLRLVEHRAGAAQQPDARHDVHLLGEHDPVQRQPAAPLRRLLRDGRLAGGAEPPDQEHAVLHVPVPGEGAGAGSAGAELHAPVAADPVRHLCDRELRVPLDRDLQHPLLPVPVPQAVQARLDQRDDGGRVLDPDDRHARVPGDQVRSDPREDAQGEKGPRRRLRRGVRRRRRGHPAHPDAPAGAGVVRPAGRQASSDLRGGPRPARQPRSPRRRARDQGPGHRPPVQPREAPLPRGDQGRSTTPTTSRPRGSTRAPTPPAAPTP